MYTKTVTYKDFAGKEHKETLNFELNTMDVLEMHYGTPGGIVKALDDVINHENPLGILLIVKTFVMMSYGKLNKSKTQFDKSTTAKMKFMNSKAYPAIMEILLYDKTGKELSDFLDGVLPEEIKTGSYKKTDKLNINIDLDLKNLNKKTIFDDLSNLGFKLKNDK